MEEKEKKEIIAWINKRYDEEVPGPVKFVVRRKAKRIETLNIEEFPDSVRKCTFEEFLAILQEAYKKKKLKF